MSRMTPASLSWLSFLLIAIFIFIVFDFRVSATTSSGTIYFTNELTADNAVIYNGTVLSDDFASLAVMPTGDIVAAGSEGLFLFNGSNTSAAPVLLRNDPNFFIVGLLSTNQFVTLMDEDGDSLFGPGYLSGMHLWRVQDGVLSHLTGFQLSEPIFVGVDSAIFAGHNRVLIGDGASGELFEVQVPSGDVSSLGSFINKWRITNGWAALGVAEWFGDNYLLYANANGYVEQQFLPESDGMNYIQKVSTLSMLDSLSSIAVNAPTGQWVLYSEGDIAKADASFIDSFPTSQPSAQPSQQPTTQPSRQPSSQPTGKPSSQPSAQPTRQPSAQPTSQPSSQPSQHPSSQPTSAPTFHPAAPKVVSITISVTSTTLSLVATLDENSVYAGTVYCAAFSADSTIASVDQIMTSGVSTTYASKASSVSLVISGLTPLTTYDSYCYVVTVQGFTNGLQELLNTKRQSTTTCCKTVLWANNPVAIYSDTSKYDNSLANTYTFSVRINFVPKKTVVFTPVITNATSGAIISSSVLRTSPTSLSFSSSSSILTTNFVVLAAKTTLSGYFNLSLVSSGSSASEYSISGSSIGGTSLTTSVQMLAADQPPIPPVLSLVRFSSAGNSLLIYFDSATDLAGQSLGSSWLCSLVFNFVGSSRSSCIWLNTTSIEATFQSGTSDKQLPAVGYVLGLLSSKIKALCSSTVDTSVCASYSYSQAQNTTILSPVTAITPTVIITAPTAIGGCDNLTISASLSKGSAGRNWTSAVWYIRPSISADTSSIDAYLASFGVSLGGNIVIPRSFFVVARYSFTLTLTNFFGASSSATSIVDVTANNAIPVLQILGSSSISMTAKDTLSIYSNAQYSSCQSASSSLKLNYKWIIQNSAGVLSVSSTSKDPTVFSLASYSLTSGQVYTVTVNATVLQNSVTVATTQASATVTVTQGQVVAVISGGTVRQLASDLNMTLDASSSYDEDSLSTTGLSYHWACSIQTLSAYGQSCSTLLLPSAVNKSSTIIVGSALNSSYSYLFTVVVKSQDGRSSSRSVTVQPLPDGAPYTQLVTSSTLKFNADQNLSLSGLLQASVDSTVSWSVFISGQNVSVTAFTPQTRSFSADLTTDQLLTSLLLAANTFQAGTYVTFRLTATSVVASRRRLWETEATSVVNSYSEVVVQANTPPSGGTFTVSPTSGSSLSTKFNLNSAGWVDEPSDYPLYYDFRYTLSSTSPFLTIQSKGPTNTATSDFPAGSESANYYLILSSRIYDSLGGYATASGKVQVTVNNNIDVSSYLSDNLQSAISSGNSDLAFQAVNNVASTINVVNCTLANTSYCVSLNRLACSSVPNTCGSCQSGYIGISGPANTKCFSSNSTTGSVGSTCLANDDCLYGLCRDGICAEPIQNCPTSVDNTICSGHGNCLYTDMSGNSMDASSCTITNIYCVAKCSCVDGYGGSSCALDAAARVARDSDRGQLCGSVNSINGISNPSAQLLENLAGTLLAAYEPTEVVSESSVSTCQSSLVTIASLAAEGYFAGASMDTAAYLVKSTSSYVSPATSNSSSSSLVSASMANISYGILSTMTNGQDPIKLVSDNIQVTMRKDMVADVNNAVLSPPLSSAEEQYNVIPLTASFEGDALSACANSEKYVTLSIMKWGTNPYENSSSVLSPLLSMTSTKTASSTSSAVASVSSHRKLSNEGRKLETTTSSTATAAYFITLQFSSAQNFNFSLSPAEAEKLPPSNFTFPECTFQDGNEYRSCQGCNISTYTNYNVTYICYDITQVCGGGSSSSSAASSAWMDYNNRMHSGKLTWEASGDDDNTGGGALSISQYGALFMAVKGVLTSVLTSNPFNMDIEQAKTILSFIGSLVVIIVIGGSYFLNWDRYDRNQLIYAQRWPPKAFIRNWNLFNRKKSKKNWKGEVGEDHKVSKLLTSSDDNGTGNLESNDASESAQHSNEQTEKGPSSRKKRRKRVGMALNIDPLHEIQRQSSKQRRGKLQDLLTDLTAKSIDQMEKRKQKRALNKVTAKMDTFLVNGATTFYDLALPDIFQHNALYSFFMIVLTKHDYSTIFFKPSISSTRFARWIGLWKSILIGLFIDTIFFSVFYGSTSTCEGYYTHDDCVASMNSVTNEPTCVWTADSSGSSSGSCDLRQPPSDIVFTVILALICVIVGVPCDMVFSFILEEYASKRPVLEEIGLNTDFWVGTSNATNEYEDDKEKKEAKKSILAVEIERAEKRWTPLVKEILLTEEANPLPVYTHYLTENEEFHRIMKIVRSHHEAYQYVDSMITQIEEDIRQEIYRGRTRALMEFLGILPDGSLSPLRFWDRLFYRSKEEKLWHKLRHIKKREKFIIDAVEESGEYGAEVQEVALLQYYILEQFSTFQRWILQNQLFCFESFSPEEISAIPWIMAWTFVIGSMIFYIYWILAWGVQTGNKLMYAWGMNFLVGVIQDIFFVQVVKLFVVYAIAIFTIRPQLRALRLRLQNLTMAYLSGSLPARKIYMTLQHTENMKAIQAHDQQPPPVLATPPKIGKKADLKKASSSRFSKKLLNDSQYNLLYKLDRNYNNRDVHVSMATFRVVQTYSSACRAAWFPSCAELGVAKILRSLDDIDAVDIKYTSTGRLGLAALLAVAVPFVAYTFFGDAMGDVIVDMVLPSCSSGFILANSYLLQYSMLALVVIYVGGLIYYAWYKGWFHATAVQVMTSIVKRNMEKEEQEEGPGNEGDALLNKTNGVSLIEVEAEAEHSSDQGSNVIRLMNADHYKPLSERQHSLCKEITTASINYVLVVIVFVNKLLQLLHRLIFWNSDYAKKKKREALRKEQAKATLWQKMNLPSVFQAQTRIDYHSIANRLKKYEQIAIMRTRSIVGVRLEQYLSQSMAPVEQMAMPSNAAISVEVAPLKDRHSFSSNSLSDPEIASDLGLGEREEEPVDYFHKPPPEVMAMCHRIVDDNNRANHEGGRPLGLEEVHSNEDVDKNIKKVTGEGGRSGYLMKLLTRRLVDYPSSMSSHVEVLATNNTTSPSALRKMQSRKAMRRSVSCILLRDGNNAAAGRDVQSGVAGQYVFQFALARRYANDHISAAQLSRLVMLAFVNLYLQKYVPNKDALHDELIQVERRMTSKSGIRSGLSVSFIDFDSKSPVRESLPVSVNRAAFLLTNESGDIMDMDENSEMNESKVSSSHDDRENVNRHGQDILPVSAESTEDLSELAEYIVDHGLDNPLLIRDVRSMMRQVWSLVPFYRYLTLNQAVMRTLPSAMTSRDCLGEEEVQEIMSEMNIWIYAHLQSQRDVSMQYCHLQDFVEKIVNRITSIVKNQMDHLKAKISQTQQERRRNEGSEADSGGGEEGGPAIILSNLTEGLNTWFRPIGNEESHDPQHPGSGKGHNDEVVVSVAATDPVVAEGEDEREGYLAKGEKQQDKNASGSSDSSDADALFGISLYL